MFCLSAEPLDAEALKTGLEHASAGACVTFEGWVRDHNEGRTVERLDYEAYAELARREGERVIEEARQQFGLLEACCVHRTGSLAIGDLAVWTGVSAAHRDEAFKACRYIIDEIKHRLPIWKKEFYTDGDSGWVNCERCAAGHHRHPAHTSGPAPAFAESDYYARQLLLPQVGPHGQQALKDSRVLIVGTGGLGSPAALHLAAAGVGCIGLCEGDELEASNLHRQILFAHEGVGQAKVHLAAERLRALNPFIAIREHAHSLESGEAAALFQEYDLVLDCTDNFTAKFLINDAAIQAGIPAIFASIHQFEGQLQVVDGKRGDPCLRCLWDVEPLDGCVGTCTEAGVVGVVPGLFGTLQATEALKYLIGLDGCLRDELLILNLLSYNMHRIKVKRKPGCAACAGARPAVPAATRPASRPEEFEVHAESLGKDGLSPFELVDIRERSEAAARPIQGFPVRALPASEVDLRALEFEPDRAYVLCCSRGLRSKYLSLALRRKGFERVYSLKGGVEDLAKNATFRQS